MKIFIDTEFIESGAGKPIYLLSLGAVTEKGEAFYGEVLDAPYELANDWVKENVLPHLDIFTVTGSLNKYPELSCRFVREGLAALGEKFKDWVDEQCDIPRRGDQPPDKPEFWGYYTDYDWVVLCQLYGAMIDLPKGWPMYCRDLKQWADQLGNPKLPKQDDTEHNALHDAIWNRKAYRLLEQFEYERDRENNRVKMQNAEAGKTLKEETR